MESGQEVTIRVLSKRVGLVEEVSQEILMKMDKLEDFLTELTSKIQQGLQSKVLERLTPPIGQIALKEGVSEKTVRRKIQEPKIPAIKREGDKSYKISMRLIMIL